MTLSATTSSTSAPTKQADSAAGPAGLKLPTLSRTITYEELTGLDRNLHRAVKDVESKAFDFRVFQGASPLDESYRKSLLMLSLAFSAVMDLAGQVYAHGEQLLEVKNAGEQLPASLLQSH